MPATDTYDQHRALAADLARFVHNPRGFVLYAYPWGEPGTILEHEAGPREWQGALLDDIGRKLRAGYGLDAALAPVLEARASGHGIGKSALVAWVIQWALSTFEDTRITLTANTQDQLRTKTWPEVSKWFNLLICRLWFRLVGQAIYSNVVGHERTWRCDAVTWSETNLEAFAGLHNKGKRLVLLFDEASGIHDRVWETAEGALTDEGTEIVWLALGNPTQPVGRFFECFNRQRERWGHRQIDSRTVKGTNTKLIEEWRQAYGEDSDFFRVRVLGEFPRVGSTQFIGTQVVEEAAKRDVAAMLSDAMVIGVDVARQGDDRSVIFFRKGRDARLIPPVVLRIPDLMQVAARVAAEAEQYRADGVFVDQGGMGAGVVDRCRQLRVNGLIGVDFGSKPDRSVVGSGAERGSYANKRAEMWGVMRDWLPGGGIPDDADLKADLTGPQYGYNAHNAIQLERKEDMKKRGLASPDMGDALALTFAYPVQPAAFSGGPQAVVQRQRDYDPHRGV